MEEAAPTHIDSIIEKLTAIQKAHGNIKVCDENMQALVFSLEHPTDAECIEAHGETYLLVERR